MSGKSLVRALARLELAHGGARTRRRGAASTRGARGERALVSRGRRDRLEEVWKAGIVTSILARRGMESATGAAEEAASLLADHGWRETTWSNRLSQVRKWFAFCEEERRNLLPAEEGDVLAYIGFLPLKGRVSASSAPQYVSAVSGYQINHGFASPTLTPDVRDLQKAYANKARRSGPDHLIRTGCGTPLMMQVLQKGLTATEVEDFGSCAMTIFAFIFQCRAVTVAHMAPCDVRLASGCVTERLRHEKGKSYRRPLT